MRHGLLPSLQDFLFIVLLAGALASGSRMLNTDSDLGRHLTLGSYILSSGRIPTTNILSFTKPGAPRPPYEWLAQVLLAATYRLLNLDGIVLLTAIVIAAAFSVVYLDSVRRSQAPILALLVTAWSAIASSLHWLPRPHIFSFLFFAIWLFWLESLRREQKVRLWQFPALMLIWSNTHGGFIYGFLALGAYFAGWLVDLLRGSAQRPLGIRLLVVGVTSLVATAVTPDLWHNWDAVLNNRSGYILSQTVETMPLRLATPSVWPFLVMVAAAVILLAARRFRASASHILLLAALAAASFAMVRNIPLFAIAAAPILCDWAAQLMVGVSIWRRVEDGFAKPDSGLLRYLWSTVAVVLVVGLFTLRDAQSHAPVFQFRAEVFPVQAADWVVSHPPSGRMFNDFNWGGYLLYRLWPNNKVFIDSQSDFYGEALTREYASTLEGADGWQATLSRYKVEWIVIPPSAGLAAKVRRSQTWYTAYQDSTAVIFVHR
jgi:hypothetical protein